MFWTKTANSLQPCKTQVRLGNITDPLPESHQSAWLHPSPLSTGANRRRCPAISRLPRFSTIFGNVWTKQLSPAFSMARTANNQPLSIQHQWKNEQTSCWVVNILHVPYRWCHSFQAPVFWLNSSEGVPMNSLLIASCNLSRLAPKCIIAESYETIWADAASLVRAIISLISFFSTQALLRYGNTLTYNPKEVKR